MKNYLLYVLFGFVTGGLVMVLTMSFFSPELQNGISEMDMAMSGMVHGLEGKSGAEFDKAFLANMIVHHQGAIEMAKMAEMSSEFEPIRQMAKSIIEVQTLEIAQMQEMMKNY